MAKINEKSRKKITIEKTAKNNKKPNLKTKGIAKIATKVTKTNRSIDSIDQKNHYIMSNRNREDEKNKRPFPFVLVIVIVAILAIVIVFVAIKNKSGSLTTVSNIEELTKKIPVKVKEPQNVKNITYGIENNNIARIEYSKEVSDGKTMDFVLKSSSATEDLVDYKNDFNSIAILMTVICNDGSDIEVTSFVAVDVPTLMKSEWFDNDVYYAMTTENLTSREDFLQEVNRVIIDNHVEF